MPLARWVGGIFLPSGWRFGTIVDVSQHRPRFTDEDLAVVLAALRARHAMSTGLRRHRIERLLARLEEATRGNPKWILGEYQQTHEDDLELDDDE